MFCDVRNFPGTNCLFLNLGKAIKCILEKLVPFDTNLQKDFETKKRASGNERQNEQLCSE